jgi:Zn-dependent peptidase ImmA (M78 family)
MEPSVGKQLFSLDHDERRRLYKSWFPENPLAGLHIPIRFAINRLGVTDETELAAAIAVDIREKLTRESPKGKVGNLDVQELAIVTGVKLRELNAEPGTGLLVPVYNGFLVLIAPADEPERQRTICHELAHTYFYDRSSLIPRRPGRMKPDKIEEEICETAARFMLSTTTG